MTKVEALAKFIGVNKDDIVVDEGVFNVNDEEYLVFDDDEADEKAYEEIEQSLWAFKAEFILEMCGFNCDYKPLTIMQENACEDCNEFIKAMIEGTCTLDTFVQSAIEADGRGHFIATYDGEENEQDDFYIYRIN